MKDLQVIKRLVDARADLADAALKEEAAARAHALFSIESSPGEWSKVYARHGDAPAMMLVLRPGLYLDMVKSISILPPMAYLTRYVRNPKTGKGQGMETSDGITSPEKFLAQLQKWRIEL